MIEFQVNGKQYVAVELVRNYSSYEMSEERPNYLKCKTEHITQGYQLPAGNYKIIGLVKDLRHSYEHNNWVLDYVFNYPELMEKYNLSDNHLIIEKIG